LQTVSAAAELDNFYYVKIWTRTVLAEISETVCKLKRGLIGHKLISPAGPLNLPLPWNIMSLIFAMFDSNSTTSIDLGYDLRLAN